MILYLLVINAVYSKVIHVSQTCTIPFVYELFLRYFSFLLVSGKYKLHYTKLKWNEYVIHTFKTNFYWNIRQTISKYAPLN
jgi:hypothetical protein